MNDRVVPKLAAVDGVADVQLSGDRAPIIRIIIKPNALAARDLTIDNLNSALNNYELGTACSVVLVRAFYTWSVLTPLLTPFLVNMSSNDHLIYAASAFRNEPFSTGMSGC